MEPIIDISLISTNDTEVTHYSEQINMMELMHIGETLKSLQSSNTPLLIFKVPQSNDRDSDYYVSK